MREPHFRSMEPGGGEVAAKRAKLSSDGATAGSEDRLSALPDDILVLILRRLGTAAAGRTSVLSHRWRRVWTFLPYLLFMSSDHRQIGPALQAHEAALRCLFVETRDATPDSVATWLPAAARRLSGRLLFQNNIEQGRSAQESDDEETSPRGAVDLPCLERATSVSLHLGFLGLAVPPAGVFARLTDLRLDRVRLHGPGELGDAVSTPRCPCLRNLTVRYARGVDNLVIHSDSLQEVELNDLRDLRQLTIVAPALKGLEVTQCFYSRNQPVASISAPQLVTLAWTDPYDPSSVHLGEMEHLQRLRPPFIFVYGQEVFPHNDSCLSLLQRFKVIEGLILSLAYLMKIDDYEYMMEDMTMLPGITFLHLNVLANGHAFGSSAFHVLRMCSGIKRLRVALLAPTNVEAQTTCPSGCICSEHQNWETEQLLLNRLQEVEITRVRGSEHEVNFVKQVFKWATFLERMTVALDDSVTESVAKELSQVLRSLSRPQIHMEILTCQEMMMKDLFESAQI